MDFNLDGIYNNNNKSNDTIIDFPTFDEICDIVTKFFKKSAKAIGKFFNENTKVIIGVGIVFLVIVCLCPSIFVGIIHCIGFGVAGIGKGTYAAALMASYGGYVLAKSLCAILQSVGAVGLNFLSFLKLLLNLVVLFFRWICCC